MSLSLTGLPAVVLFVGFVIVFATPVWLGARIVGADNPTLLRSIASLVVGMLGSAAAAAVTGGWALLLAPLVFLLSFKYVLGTSLLGSIVLAIVAALGYVAMGHLFGGGLPASHPGMSV